MRRTRRLHRRQGWCCFSRLFVRGWHGERRGLLNSMCPGFVPPEPQLQWIATPEQIAPFVVYLASAESKVVSGGIFPIDSGYMVFKSTADLIGLVSSEVP